MSANDVRIRLPGYLICLEKLEASELKLRDSRAELFKRKLGNCSWKHDYEAVFGLLKYLRKRIKGEIKKEEASETSNPGK